MRQDIQRSRIIEFVILIVQLSTATLGESGISRAVVEEIKHIMGDFGHGIYGCLTKRPILGHLVV